MPGMTGAAREQASELPIALGSEVPEPEVAPARKKSRRGFASMDAEKQRAIASLGGKAAHERGTAHEFTTEEAREAGRLGGRTAQQRRSERRTGR
jgi:hypothetical protein